MDAYVNMNNVYIIITLIFIYNINQLIIKTKIICEIEMPTITFLKYAKNDNAYYTNFNKCITNNLSPVNY